MNEEKDDSKDTNYGHGYETVLLYRIRRSTGWTAFFTLVTAIGAGVAAYLFWQQFNQMQALSDRLEREAAASKRTMEDLSELIDQGIDASNKRTAAFQKLAEIASSGELGANRPWVGVDSVVPTRALVINQPYGLRVLIRNGGRSPALAVRAVLNTAVRPSGDLSLPSVDECSNCARPIILPNGTLGYEVTINADVLTKDVADQLNSGTNTILVFGRIDYSDSAAKTHLTTVCMKYDPSSAFFDACAQGNDSN
jgi:hypothetical protein